MHTAAKNEDDAFYWCVHCSHTEISRAANSNLGTSFHSADCRLEKNLFLEPHRMMSQHTVVVYMHKAVVRYSGLFDSISLTTSIIYCTESLHLPGTSPHDLLFMMKQVQ